MNKQLKLLQRSKVLKTLEVEKVKHDLSKIKNSTIVMVAYDDATDKFLIGDNSGDLYVATSEYLKSLDIKNSSIDSIINGMTKSSIAQHFNKISLQEAKEMFGKKYLYYWSANNKIYGVKRGIIERLDNGPDNTSVVELWSRTENVLSNDRGVTGLKEVKFSSELRPAFLTFNKDAIPTYTRDNYLTVRDPVKVADIMNNELQNHDYVPKDDKYGYDMKDSNAVMKAYLGTDDLVILSNIDKREVIDIDPPNTDPDNPDVEYNNNTPFNHNYNMVWSTIRSARLFEEFNDEINDNNSNFVNTTRHERSELTNFTLNNHIDAAGLYANIPNLADTYTTYINGKGFGDKQIYSSGIVAVSIKNDFKWSLDRIDGDKCTITKRVYNSVTGEVTNAQRTYNGIVEFEIVNIKDNTTRIRKTFKIPSLNNTVCEFDKFEYKHDSNGTAISLPIPEEYENGIIEYKLDTTRFAQGTNGKISYGLREIYIQSGATKYLIDSTNGTGTATFSVYTLAANSTSATIKRNTEIIFKNTDGTNYSYKTINNGIGTGSVEHLVANTPTGVSNNNHISRHTRNVHYMSGSTDVVCKTDYSDPNVNYKIYTLNAGSTTATLKGSSTGTFKTISNGSETNTTYNVVKNDHITVTSNTITYTRNTETYTSASDITCSQTMNVDYTYGGVTIRKTITKSAAVNHSIYTLAAKATSATIKRVFTPIFYTISAGVESSSIIYKNDTITIDTNKTATVSHTVNYRVTSASGSNYYTQHTRTVTYTQNDVTVTVNTVTVDAPVTNFKVYILRANDKTAMIKGSSTGVFKTYVNGSETSTTYNVAKTNHVTEFGDVSYTASSSVTSASGHTHYATHTRTVTYTYKNVTVTIDSVTVDAPVTNFKVYTLGANATTATLKGSSTGTFKIIVDGSETDTTYNVNIDDHITVQGDVSYTASSSVTSASGSNHYATHTRTVTYTQNDVTVTVNTVNYTTAAVSYKIWTLNGRSTTAALKGSSTGKFKTIVNGSETDTTYNVVQTNHVTEFGNVSHTVSDSITSASGSNHYATHTRTVNYTYKNVTVTIDSVSYNTAAITYKIWTLGANATTATLKGSSTGVFKTIVNGSETDTTYDVAKTDHITVNGSKVSHTVSDHVTSASGSDHYTTYTRTVTYTQNDVTVTVNTATCDTAEVSYKIWTLGANATTATVKGSSTGVFKTIVNGYETDTTYDVAKTDHITAQVDVSYTARDEITSASGSTHYTTHARIVTYRYNNMSKRIDYTYVDAPITYKIIELDGPNYVSIPVKGSSTGTFKTISNGSETDTTYNVVQTDHIILNGAKISYTASDHVTSASGSDHYTTYTRTVTYTNKDYPDVTVTVNTATCDTAKVNYYKIYTLNAGSTTATLKGSSTGTFKIIVDGSETDTTYNVNIDDHITVQGDVSLSDIIYSYTYGSKEAYIRLTAKYTFNNVTKTVTINSGKEKITLIPKYINERENTVTFGRSYSAFIRCINNFNSISTYYFNGSRSLPDVTGSITQTLDVGISDANYYEFKTVIEDDTDYRLVNTNSMNITKRLGNVTLKEAASMLLNNTDNAKNKVYIGDYFELGGYNWENNAGTTFTAGTAKYTLVERTSDNHLIFMSSERHKLTSESGKALPWTQLITENKLETLLLPQLESILGITPVSYTRKSDIPHLTNKKVFLPTEYEIFGKYNHQKENERYSGERQWEIFRIDKEERRRYFRRDVITGDINNYSPSNDNNGYGYWLATNSYKSGYASNVYDPGRSDFGVANFNIMTSGGRGVRPCFML